MHGIFFNRDFCIYFILGKDKNQIKVIKTGYLYLVSVLNTQFFIFNILE